MDIWVHLFIHIIKVETIRPDCAYLNRKIPDHTRASEPFSKNISRPHQALRFGKETRTPIQEAGLVSKYLDIKGGLHQPCGVDSIEVYSYEEVDDDVGAIVFRSSMM